MNIELFPVLHCELDFSQGFIYCKEPVSPDLAQEPW